MPAKILIQLDSDPQASAFDAITGVDAGVDCLLQYSGVQPAQVRDLVHGAIFTRGIDRLHNTAIFVGGSDVALGEAILEQVEQAFVGPLCVSVMIDSNGCNTTAVAAVLAARRHLELKDTLALVLGATGPVGQRVVRLLASCGACVRAGSRSHERAAAVCRRIAGLCGPSIPPAEPCEVATDAQFAAAIAPARLLVAAGAAGIQLVPDQALHIAAGLRVAIDLNAVPPAGVAGVDVADRGTVRDGVACYGAAGIGGMKMKVHRAAIRELFTAHDRVLDLEEIFALAEQMDV
jgi:hypothetical protein